MANLKLKNKSKKKIKIKLLFLITIFFSSLYFMFKYLVSTNIKISDDKLVNYLLHDYNDSKIIKEEISNKLSTIFSINGLLNMYPVLKQENIVKTSNKKLPLIYIYNSHQTEEYKSTTFAEYSVNPTVFIADYIMQDQFLKNNIESIVEERSVAEVRNMNNWNYAGSYKASRILMEDSYKQNTSLKYFIDLHRDSLKRDKTTIEIDEKEYAKIIFLIGLENPNYEQNLIFTETINNKINEKYPGLSKGIYKKGGEGVNGVYNQDFSKYTILIEVGGEENTVTEVMNTTIAITNILSEVILENEDKERS